MLNDDKECTEKIKETKVVSHHTKNLLRSKEIEEEELIDEICEKLDEDKT
jgi:hypothetical protein